MLSNLMLIFLQLPQTTLVLRVVHIKGKMKSTYQQTLFVVSLLVSLCCQFAKYNAVGLNLAFAFVSEMIATPPCFAHFPTLWIQLGWNCQKDWTVKIQVFKTCGDMPKVLTQGLESFCAEKPLILILITFATQYNLTFRKIPVLFKKSKVCKM